MFQEPAKKRRTTLAKVATITQLMTPMKTMKRVGSILQVVFLIAAQLVEIACVMVTLQSCMQFCMWTIYI